MIVLKLSDANSHRLVHSVYRHMQIPEDQWADAIEARGIIVAGFKKPWDITIGTLPRARTSSEGRLRRGFLEDRLPEREGRGVVRRLLYVYVLATAHVAYAHVTPPFGNPLGCRGERPILEHAGDLGVLHSFPD